MTDDLKPYPEYKDSGLPWCPRIPSHWDLRPNRSLIRQRKILVGERYSEYTLLSLTKRGVIVRDLTGQKGKHSADMSTFQEVRPGDIVMCLFDVPETPRTVGRSDYFGMITGAYTVFDANDLTSSKWFEAFYIAMDDRKLLSPLYSGLRNTIPRPKFLGTKIPCPTPEEQLRIVEIIGYLNKKVNRFIHNRRRLIEVLNEQKQAIINRAVTCGLNSDVPFKPSGIDWMGDMPDHWNCVRLKQVARVQTGITLGKNYQGQPLEERPYLRVANVQAGRLDLRKVKTLKLPSSEISGRELVAGDVLMTEGGDIDKLGRGCVWRGEIDGCLHQNHVFAVRVDRTRVVPDYLAALMASQHGRIYFEITAKRTTNLASTNSTTLGAFPLLLPGIDEQKAVLDSINENTKELDALLGRAEAGIRLIREYRTRLISDVVTGKIDVRHLAPSVGSEDLEEATEVLEPLEDVMADVEMDDKEDFNESY